MVVVMAPEATAEDVAAVVDLVQSAGGAAFVSRGVNRTIVGLVGDVEQFGSLNLRGMRGVRDVIRISVPYKLVSRENHPDRSVVRVGGVPIGPDTLTLIAGPCAVETPEQTLGAALMAKAAGADILLPIGTLESQAAVAARLAEALDAGGGAFKPRTSPYAFQGLGEAGLKILADVRTETGLPVVTEVVDARDVDLVASYADMLQVGTRTTQNFSLLQAVGQAGKPVMLKRGMNGTIDEWLMSAATSTSSYANAASAPSKKPPATPWTSPPSPSPNTSPTYPSSSTPPTQEAAATWYSPSPEPPSPSAPTASSSTSTPTQRPPCATDPRPCPPRTSPSSAPTSAPSAASSSRSSTRTRFPA